MALFELPQMPFTYHSVDGYEEFIELIQQLEKKKSKPIFVYFEGTKLLSGESWSSQCNNAKPEIQKALESVTDGHFINVEVGTKKDWENPKLPFKTDKDTMVMVLPTLIKWKTSKRLKGDDCARPDLLETLFKKDEK